MGRTKEKNQNGARGNAKGRRGTLVLWNSKIATEDRGKTRKPPSVTEGFPNTPRREEKRKVMKRRKMNKEGKEQDQPT